MAQKRKVISLQSLPTRSPIMMAVVLWLLLDRLHAPQWLFGAIGLFCAVCFAGWIYAIFTEDRRDPFEEIQREIAAATHLRDRR